MKIFCYRASFDGYEAFGATKRGAMKILEEVVRMRDGSRAAMRAERDAFVIPIVPGVLHDGQPVAGAGFDDLVEAGGRGVAGGRKRR